VNAQAKPISEVVKDFEQSLENLRPSTRRVYVAGARSAIRAANLELWQCPSAAGKRAYWFSQRTDPVSLFAPFHSSKPSPSLTRTPVVTHGASVITSGQELKVSRNHVLDVRERVFLADGRLEYFGPGPDLHLDMFVLASLGLERGLRADVGVGQDSLSALDNDPVVVLESSTAFSRIPSRRDMNFLRDAGSRKLTTGASIGQDCDDGE
jgi:hypothetical protein